MNECKIVVLLKTIQGQQEHDNKSLRTKLAVLV